MSATPDSWAMICWVRRARRAASSVGSAERLVARVGVQRLVPPSTAASAWSVTRTMLLSGCCAVSIEPAVWAWKRSIIERGSFALKRSFMMRGPQPPGGAELGDLLEEVVVGVEEEARAAPAKSSTSRPAVSAAST